MLQINTVSSKIIEGVAGYDLRGRDLGGRDLNIFKRLRPKKSGKQRHLVVALETLC